MLADCRVGRLSFIIFRRIVGRRIAVWRIVGRRIVVWRIVVRPMVVVRRIVGEP